jgi:hypothetical protein
MPASKLVVGGAQNWPVEAITLWDGKTGAGFWPEE